MEHKAIQGDDPIGQKAFKNVFVFTGSVPEAPGRNFAGIWAQTKTWIVQYILGVGGQIRAHKMSVLLSTIGALLLVVPILNVLVLLMGVFFGSYVMGLLMHVQRQKVSSWWDAGALKSFKHPGWIRVVSLSLLWLVLMIVISSMAGLIGMAPFISLMFGSAGSGPVMMSLILSSMAALIVIVLLMQVLFYVYLLTVPLVFFHKQSVLGAFSFAMKATRVHWRQLVAMGNVSIISGFVLGLCSALLGITVIGLVLFPLVAGYFIWMQFHMISVHYKYMLLEYKTVPV